MSYYQIKAYFAALDYEQAKLALHKGLAQRKPMAELDLLLQEHDKAALEAKELDRQARARIGGY